MLIEQAMSSMDLEGQVDFFVRDTNVIHLCVQSTCPYCDMRFGARSFLIDHLDRREVSGGCFSS